MYSGFVFGGGTVHCHLFIYLFRLQLFFYHSVRFFFFFSHFFSCFALVFSILLFFVLVVVSIGIHHSIVDACVQFLLDFSLVYNSSKCECVSFCVWLWNELWNRILYNIAISPFRCYSLVSTIDNQMLFIYRCQPVLFIRCALWQEVVKKESKK